MNIWYLYHSSFAVETETHFFIFDYYRDTPQGGLADGVVDPAALKEKNVVAFSSHSHHDHFNSCIFDWQKQIPGIRYVLSDDIRTTQKVYKIHGGQALDLGDLQVRAFCSTDLGVAFLVQADGQSIFHAGDLNWWNWPGESKLYRDEMERCFKEQIDLLAGIPIDAAFFPVDPRLEKNALDGVDYLMRTLDVRFVIPMHFWEDLSVFERLQSDARTKLYRGRISGPFHRGDRIKL